MQNVPNSTNTISGIAKEVSEFPCVNYLDDVQLSDGLLDGTISSAAVIACSDMGWLVPYVCSSDEAQLHLFQNFGHKFDTGGLVETVTELSIENLIVYGHSVCQFTRNQALSSVEKSDNGNNYSSEDKLELDLYRAAIQSDDEKDWSKLAQYNVLKEIKGILTDPNIGLLAKKNKLSLQGWFFSSKTQQLEVFDPIQQKFVVPNTKLKSKRLMKFVPDQSQVRED